MFELFFNVKLEVLPSKVKTFVSSDAVIYAVLLYKEEDLSTAIVVVPPVPVSTYDELDLLFVLDMIYFLPEVGAETST